MRRQSRAAAAASATCSGIPAFVAVALLLVGAFMFVGAVVMGAPVRAQASGETEAYWVENPSLMMTLTPIDPASAGAGAASGVSPVGSTAAGSAAGTAAGTAPSAPIIGEVFDSADYQSTLLLPAGWDCVYLLDLANAAVSVYPRAAVVDAAGALKKPDPAAGKPAGVFVTDSDGRMTFADERCDVVVGPTPPLIGAITRAELDQRQPVYGRRAASYRPDPAIVAQFASVSRPLQVLAFFGSWCSTCKHYLPGLIATLDRAANAKIKITYIGVDENIVEPADWIARYHVSTTPVVIVLSNGAEIGRVESEPRTTMEADLAAVLKGELTR